MRKSHRTWSEHLAPSGNRRGRSRFKRWVKRTGNFVLGLFGARPAVKRDWEYVPSAADRAVSTGMLIVAIYLPQYAGKPWSAAVHAAERRMAKQYGIRAFCYCLTDPRTERQLLRDAREAAPEFAFCLCVSITTPVLDILEETLQSANYLRLAGRAVLLVRNTSIDPEFGATVDRWRNSCRDLGLGELLVVAVGASNQQPNNRVRDAVIDWIADLASSPKPRAEEARAPHYSELVRGSMELTNSSVPSFQLVRCRVGKEGASRRLVNLSPATFQEWFENACRSALKQHGSCTRGVVFVDAWNGPPERGALTPNARYGYAYLNAISKALRAVASEAQPRDPSVAVIVHSFYDDIWREISDHLATWTVPFRLYVSLPEDRYEAASRSIRRDYPTAVTIPAPNRGRDIAAFLALAKKADDDGIEIICKVHTKRSAHRSNGEEWRHDLFAKVLGTGGYPQLIISALRDNPAIGLIIPQGHAISGRHFWGANEQRVLDLAEKIGYQRPLGNFAFPAGSMFWMRTDALRPILDLGLSFSDFEEEAGQYDGTLAHAVERLLPIAARIRGYRTVDTRVIGWKAANGKLRSDLELAVMREPVTDYPFAPTQRSKHDEH